MSNTTHSPPTAPLERLLWMGVPESLVAQLTDTILSMQAASSRGEVNMEPVLRDLLTKLSTDASNFIGSLNEFCQAVSEACTCTVKANNSPEERRQARSSCCTPTCSCCSTDSEEIDCESLDCECDLEPFCTSVLPKKSLGIASKDSLGVGCQVRVLEEELTEVSTYRIDPITKKVKISKVEEYSQISKRMSLKNQSMQTCECLDSENMKAYGDAVMESVSDKKPSSDYNKIIPISEKTETEPSSDENELKPLPEEDETTEPPFSDIDFVTDQEESFHLINPTSDSMITQNLHFAENGKTAENRGDVSCACQTTQTEPTSNNRDTQTQRYVTETQQNNQLQITGVDSSDSPPDALQPFPTKSSNRNMQCVDVCCSCRTTQMEEEHLDSPHYTTEQESSPLGHLSSQDAASRVDYVIEQRLSSQFNPSNLEQLPCTVSTCSVLSRIPSSTHKRGSREKQLNSPYSGPVGDEEKFPLVNRLSPTRSPCRISTCSVLSAVPSSRSKRETEDEHAYSSKQKQESPSLRDQSNLNKEPGTLSTCSVLSQTPSSYSKRENEHGSSIGVKKKSENGQCGDICCGCQTKGKLSSVSKRRSNEGTGTPSADKQELIFLSNRTSSKIQPCTPSTCSVLSKIPSFQNQEGRAEKQSNSILDSFTTAEETSSLINPSVLSQAPSSHSKKGNEADLSFSSKQIGKDGRCGDVCCGCPAEQKLSYVSKRTSKEGQDFSNQSIPKKRGCTNSTCSVVSGISSSYKNPEIKELTGASDSEQQGFKRPRCTLSTCSALSQAQQHNFTNNQRCDGKCGGGSCPCSAAEQKQSFVSKRESDDGRSSPSAGFLIRPQSPSLSNQIGSKQRSCTPSTCSVLSQVPSYNRKDGVPVSSSVGTATEKENYLSNQLSTSTKPPCTPSTCSILSQVPSYNRKYGVPVSSAPGTATEKENYLPNQLSTSTKPPCTPSTCSVLSQVPSYNRKDGVPVSSSVGTATEKENYLSNQLSTSTKPPCTPSTCSILSQVPSYNRKYGVPVSSAPGTATEKENYLPNQLSTSTKPPCTPSTCSILSQVPSYNRKDGVPVSSAAGTATEKENYLPNQLSTSTKPPCTPSTCSVLSQMPPYNRKDGVPVSFSADIATEKENYLPNQLSTSTEPPCTPSNCSVFSQVPSYHAKQESRENSPLPLRRRTPCTSSTCSVLSQVPSYHDKQKSKEKRRVVSPVASITEYAPSISSKKEEDKGKCGYSCCGCHLALTELGSRNYNIESTFQKEYDPVIQQESSLLSKLPNRKKRPCTSSTCSVLSQVPSLHTKQGSRGGRFGSTINQEPLLPTSTTPEEPHISSRSKLSGSRNKLSVDRLTTQYSNNLTPKTRNRGECPFKLCCTCSVTEPRSTFHFPAHHEPISKSLDKGQEKRHSIGISGFGKSDFQTQGIIQKDRSTSPASTDSANESELASSITTDYENNLRTEDEKEEEEAVLSYLTDPEIKQNAVEEKLALLDLNDTANTPEPTETNRNEASLSPSSVASATPTSKHATAPPSEPALELTSKPATEPTSEPAIAATSKPATAPTSEPTTTPTSERVTAPISKPATAPTSKSATAPTSEPTTAVTSESASALTSKPDRIPTSKPATESTSESATTPTSERATVPTSKPATAPTSKSATGPASEPTTAITSKPARKPTSKPATEPTSKPATTPTSEHATAPTSKPATAPTSKSAAAPTSKPTAAITSESASTLTSKPARIPTSKSAIAPTSEPAAVPTSEPATVPTSEAATALTSEPATSPTSPTSTDKRKDKDSTLPTESAKKSKRKSKERRASGPVSAESTNKLESLPPTEGKRKSRDRKSREERAVSPYSTDSTNEAESVTPSMKKKKSRDVPTSMSFTERFITPSPGAVTESINTAAFEREQQGKTEPFASTDATAQPESVASPTEGTLPEDMHPEMSLKQLFEKQRQKLSVDQGICTSSRNKCSCVPSQELPRDKCICSPCLALPRDKCTCAPSQELHRDKCTCVPSQELHRDTCVCAPQELPSAVDGRVKKWVERLSATEQTLASLRAKIETFSIGLPTKRQCDETCGAPSPSKGTPQVRTRPERSCCHVPAFVTVGCDVSCSHPEHHGSNYYRRCTSPCTKPGQYNKSVNARSTSRRSTSPPIPVHTIPLMPPQAIPIPAGSIDNHQRINYNRQTRSKPRNLKVDSCSCGPK